MRALLRRLFLALVRLYYPRRVIVGAEQLPAEGAVVVANHPNGLLDPILLRLGLERPVRFLAKSTLFGNPLGRLAMGAFGSIPIYRQQDPAAAAGRGVQRDRNEDSFAACRRALAGGDWLALFPEGTSHSDPQLRPLKTGAARIALSAAREQVAAGAPVALAVVPVGLVYEAKATFRSSVLLVVGRPLPVTDRLAAYASDERATVEAFTGDIRDALDEVVLQAETRDLVEGVARVAAWTAADPAGASDPALQTRRARELLEAYRSLRARDPERVEQIVRSARDYARVLGHLGVSDPWALELQGVRPGRALASLAKLLLAAPFALVGALLGWLPYRLAGTIAARVTREDDVLGTVKLLAGAAFLLVAWLAEAAGAAALGGAGWGIGVLLGAPVAGFAALRFEEIARRTGAALRHGWLRAAHPAKVMRLSERRRALAVEIAEALTDARDLRPSTPAEA